MCGCICIDGCIDGLNQGPNGEGYPAGGGGGGCSDMAPAREPGVQ